MNASGALRSLESFLPRRGYTYMLRGFNSPFLERRVVTFVSVLKSYYVCVICEAVAAKVWPLSCFHIVCDFCRNSLIGNLTESVLSDGEALDETVLSRHCAVCPADSAPFKLDNLYIEPGDLSFLECELVLCLHADSGCRFVGQLRYLEYHYYNDCPFVPRIGYRSEDI
ncbi:hypothetical protein HPB52_021151 [Rhipicephalus sanguineus]|uniref:Uncharacterized protein n=1 Tax=Rhipicephalus sanguineus TaxID=34632 RepID=A0A9D4SV49_RHISA|nr:hypothetical protein HPB52_016400 [Rhipicephalus sanguineus]KAH7952289.1 hypothetical protein HPB52_021151 [Rhipicephalus sanguineus]